MLLLLTNGDGELFLHFTNKHEYKAQIEQDLIKYHISVPHSKRPPLLLLAPKSWC